MILLRKEAISLASFMQLLSLTSDKREEVIDNALSELEKTDVSVELSNYHARKYIEYEFKWFTNDYLRSFLTSKLNCKIQVSGKEPRLYICACCNYETLIRRGWGICNVCLWEDDGTIDLQKISSPNRMTLQEAKNNFAEFGVMRNDLLPKVDADRFIRFKKSV